jgi:hypothetical protein
MLHHLVDRFEAGDVVALDLEPGFQFGFAEALQNLIGAHHSGGEPIEQRGTGNAFGLAELCGAVAAIVEMQEGCDKPLGDVAVEMEQQVADAVAGGIGPPPDLIVSERFDARAQAGPILADELLAGEGKEGGGKVVGDNIGHAARIAPELLQ